MYIYPEPMGRQGGRTREKIPSDDTTKNGTPGEDYDEHNNAASTATIDKSLKSYKRQNHEVYSHLAGGTRRTPIRLDRWKKTK
jgi:hypothetical protein